jgi:hypothetical protein
MELLPDWLDWLGRDGTSRLLGFVIEGAAGGLPIIWEFWVPVWAYDATAGFLDELSPQARRRCTIHRSHRPDPFEGTGHDRRRMAALPEPAMAPGVASQLDFAVRVIYRNSLPFADGPYERTCLREFVQLALEANRDAAVDCWYVPSVRSRHAVLLRAPKLLAFPDLVFMDFPRFFPAKPVRDHTDESWNVERAAEHLLSECDAVVSYSDDVRTRHVVGRFGIEPAKAHVIHHGRIVFAHSTRADPREDARRELMSYLAGTDVVADGTSANIIRDLHARTLDLVRLPFVFVSTALRPYKNIANAIRAIALLRREHGLAVRLVTTARIDWDGPDIGEVRQAIIEEGAFFDVVSIPGVPPDILEALYTAADVSLAISFFEGGAPFLITESLSAGTPLVVADRPFVREVLPDPDRAGLVDPFDVPAIAAAIRHAVENRSALVKEQTRIYAALMNRSWVTTASEYFDLLRTVAAQGHSSAAASPVELA